MELKLFSIVLSLALTSGTTFTIDAVGVKQLVNGRIRGNLSKLLKMPQSSPKTLMVSRSLVAKLIT